MAENKKAVNTTAKKNVSTRVAKTGQSTNNKKTDPEKKIIPKDVDPNTIVTVLNGFQGKLVYKSPRTNERFVWEEFGDEQDMELKDLRNAKSAAKAFFEKNWFMFDEANEWVIPYLGLSRYYENAIKLDEFDKIFENTPAKIKSIIDKLSSGQKKSVSYRARQLVMDGMIDSLKTISALEEALGTELIEK